TDTARECPLGPAHDSSHVCLLSLAEVRRQSRTRRPACQRESSACAIIDGMTPTAEEQARVGLCADCSHAQVITSSRGSTFYLCRLAEVDPRFRRYPALPVRGCEGYLRIADCGLRTAD